MKKKFYKSRTFWLNAISLVISIFTLMANSSWGVIPSEVIYGAIAILNILLRWLGGEPLTK